MSSTKVFKISGMTCMGCVGRIKTALENIDGISAAEVNLQEESATIELSKSVPKNTIQDALGKYIITDTLKTGEVEEHKIAAPSLVTYKPLIIIVVFIAGVSLLSQYPFTDFSSQLWMRHFMAGFFIVFSFFKLLNISGFASSYSMYDIVAAKWKGWGYIYPFVELFLGLLYLTNIQPFWTNVATIIILGVSTIGVVLSNLQKRKIKCACLGDVFNLPMSTVTIIEDVTMIAMAVFMLL